MTNRFLLIFVVFNGGWVHASEEEITRLNQQGDAYYDQASLADAEASYRKAFGLSEKQLGQSHYLTSLSARNLIFVLVDRSDFDSVENYLSIACPSAASQSIGDYDRLACAKLKAKVSWSKGEAPEALQHFKAELDLLNTSVDLDVDAKAWFLYAFAEFLIAQTKAEVDAEVAELSALLQKFKLSEPITETWFLLADHALATKNHVDASKAFSMIVGNCKAQPFCKKLELLSLINLGYLSLKSGGLSEANSYLAQAESIASSSRNWVPEYVETFLNGFRKDMLNTLGR